MPNRQRPTPERFHRIAFARRAIVANGSVTLSIALSVLALATIVLCSVVALREGGLGSGEGTTLIGALVIAAASGAEASRSARTARRRRRLSTGARTAAAAERARR